MTSTMVLFLLLLLVFPHMDKALGAHEESQKQEKTYHDARFTIPIKPKYIPKVIRPTPKDPPIPECLRKGTCSRLHLSPPPPQRSFKGTNEPGH
ncbi:transmembrane protein [Arabidopsis thaliana]|uniref:Transmembrane protein n=1 Tax=Arabidopsis thaliana TaxID=3702 RepID=F4ISJ6_ARATH|nr:uncharacterized protein AT2G25510 [Arabidopsis thaliana]AEC07711.1 transmembrane protein [Arabidopsis thaliana]|eukprot:NP_001189601.1 transmembrane protein [Arabidopsis thaliana]